MRNRHIPNFIRLLNFMRMLNFTPVLNFMRMLYFTVLNFAPMLNFTPMLNFIRIFNFIRNSSLLALLVILILFLPSKGFCDSTTSSSNNKESKESKDSEVANKKPQTLPPFYNINFSGIGNLHIKQSQTENFTVETEKGLESLPIFYVKDKTLYIDFKNASDHADSKVDYYLNIKNLKNLNSYSSANIYIDHLETDSFTLALHNFGQAIVNLDVKNLNIDIDGAAKVKTSGHAVQQAITINGAGEYDGGALINQTGKITINGNGEAKLNTSDTLDVTINGSGKVGYCGKPTVYKTIQGDGVVNSAKECGG